MQLYAHKKGYDINMDVWSLKIETFQTLNKSTLPYVSFTSLENKDNKLDWVTDLSLIRENR